MASSTHRILTICGSLQENSGNLRLLERARELAPEGLQLEPSDHLRHLPLFNPDLLEDKIPEAVERWREALVSSDGLLFACPEYGHSLPGAVKNGIDWVIGTGELYQKVVAITASVRSLERGKRGLAALKQTLLAVDAHVVWDEAILVTDAEEAGVTALLACLERAVGR